MTFHKTLLITACLGLGACLSVTAPVLAQTAETGAGVQALDGAVSARAMSRLQSGERTSVIVILNVSQDETLLAAEPGFAGQMMRQQIDDMRRAVTGRMFARNAESLGRQDAVEGYEAFELTPGFTIMANAREIAALRANPDVAHVYDNTPMRPMTNFSVAQIGAKAVWLQGYTGNGVAVEVNSETDFVAKNAEFQEMVGKITYAAQGVDSVEELLAADLGGKSVADTLTDKIATIGENMSVRRMAKLSGDTVVSYVHNAATNGMGKIGVLVALSGGDEAIGKQVAMHIAAVNPAALSEADLDPAVVEKEKQVQMDIARESGKPEQVIEKMIEGRMKKFVAESTLLSQQFVVNPDLTVEAAAKEAGATITGFIRLEVGEGIVVEKEDFAAEVAKAAQG